MITRERLNKFIRKRCHEIGRQVKVFCSTRDGEALHLLRVEAKKLRAVLALVHDCTSRHHLTAKGLKEVYKAAGAIRTAQINLAVVQDLGLENKDFAAEQQRVIEEGSIAFCLSAYRFRHAVQEMEEDLLHNTGDVKTSKVRHFFAERVQKLSLFFSAPALDTVALHDTRKETKELLYLYGLLPASLAASLHINKDYLDQLQHSLGKWHDNTVVLSLLQKFSNTDPLGEKLGEADVTLLGEIKQLTADFEHKIKGPARDAAPVEKTDEERRGGAPASQQAQQ